MRIKRIGWFCTSLLFALILTACSTESSSDDSTEGKESSDVTIAIRESITTIDAHDGSTTSANFVQNAMYERLLELDENNELQPVLATDYKVSDDGLEYTIQLRENVEFQDGAIFDASAVKVNFDRIIESEGSLNAYASVRDVAKVEVVDDHKVQIILNNPNNQFLYKLDGIRMISPQALEDENIDISQTPVGTGPFEFEEWNQGVSIVLKENSDYWDSEYPKVDQVTFQPVPENGSRVAMIKARDVDLVYPLPETDADSLNTEEGVEVKRTQSSIARYATLNTMKEPFNKKKVRKAMNYAINKEQFINVVKNGFGGRLDSIVPPVTKYYSEQTPYKYNLEKAKQLMDEAGYSDGFTAEIWGDDSSENKKSMEFIQQQLDKINIDLKINQMERGTLDNEINSPETPEEAEVQMWYVSWASRIGDTDNAIRPLFSSDAFPPNGSNTAYYKNQNVDSLIESAPEETNEDKAAEAYSEIQEIVYDDAPWLFMGVDEVVYAQSENLKGVWLSPSGGIDIKNIELQ